MDQPLTFWKGNIKFPNKAYLVFLFPDEEIILVAHSSSIEYLEEDQEEFRLREVISESIWDVDVDHMELSIDNALVNNVRWFVAHESSDGVWALETKKYNSRVSFVHYLASIFTFGIWGCVLLRKKDREIERVSKNWDRAQQELCKWEFLGREVSELLKGQELDSWLSNVSSILQYGDWPFLKTILEMGNRVKQVFGVSTVDELENALKKYQSKSVLTSSSEQQILDRLASAWGGDLNDLASHLNRWRRAGLLDQMEERLESWDRISKMFGAKEMDEFQGIHMEYERLKLDGLKLQNTIREKDELRADYLLLNRELKDLAETEEDRKIIKKLRYWGGEWSKFDRDLESLKKYGNLDSIREKLESFSQISELLGVGSLQQAEQLKNRLREIEHTAKLNTLDSSSEDGRIISSLASFCDGNLNALEREIGRLVNKYGSLGSLDERIISLEKELGDLAGTDEDKRIIRKFQNDGGLVRLERYLNGLREHGNYDSIENQLCFANNVSRLFGKYDIDSFEKLHREYEDMKERIKYLESRLGAVGSTDDFPIIQKLKSRYDGGWSELYEKLENLRKYGDLEEVCEEMDWWRKNRITYESLQRKNDEQATAIKALEEYREQAIGWEREIKEFGSPTEREVIRKLKYYEGGLLQLNRDIDNLENYGKLSTIADQLDFGKKVSHLFGSSDINTLAKIKNETLEQIPKLQQEIQHFENREKRWQNLSGGKSLEYLEDIRERNENESKTNKGLEFEKYIADILSEMDNGGVDDNFHWKAQHGVEGSRADFFVEVKNKNSQNLKMVLECKRYGNYGDELGYLSTKAVEDDVDAKKKLIDKGIKQLCEYYDKNAAGIGLLVTDIDLRSLGKKDLISRIRRDDVPEKYRGKDDMNLLLVHVSCFRTLMIVIRFVMNVCSPDVEITWGPEQMEKLHNAPDMQEFVKQVIDLYNLREKSINQMKKRFESINRASSRGQKDCVKCEEVDKKLRDCVDRIKDNHGMFSNTPLKLEGTNEDLVVEETLLDGEEE